MQLTIDPSILHTVPNFKIGYIQYDDITISESPQMIKGRTQLYQENLFLEMQDTPVTERAGIAEWRQLWKTFGLTQIAIVTQQKAYCAASQKKIISHLFIAVLILIISFR